MPGWSSVPASSSWTTTILSNASPGRRGELARDDAGPAPLDAREEARVPVLGRSVSGPRRRRRYPPIGRPPAPQGGGRARRSGELVATALREHRQRGLPLGRTDRDTAGPWLGRRLRRSRRRGDER